MQNKEEFIQDVEFEVIEPSIAPSTETAIVVESLSVNYEKTMDMNKILKNLLVLFPNGELRKIV